MRKFATILILTIVNTVFSVNQNSLAISIISDLETSSDNQVQFDTNISIKLYEVATKSTQDFVKFTVTGPASLINLKGLSFFDDKNFKIIGNDFPVHKDDSITLYFNSDKPDNAERHELYTTHKGLTGTSDQILVHSGTLYLDFFCWYKTPPSKAEISDFEKMWRENFWEENDINSCYNSEQIQNEQVLQKTGDEQNATSWKTISDTEPVNDTKKTTKTSSDSTVSDLNNLTEESDEPMDNPPLQITEIYPMPLSKEENEWLEIKNISNAPLNLDNWIVDDSAGGSKSRRLPPQNLPSSGLVLLNLKDIKITLNNDSDSVRIFQPDGTLVTSRNYTGGKKGQSYSMITMGGQESWEWTDKPTPGRLNPILTSINGKIISPAQFQSEYFFAMEDTEKIRYMVIFDEDLVKAPLAKEIFATDINGIFTGEITEAPDNPNSYQKILKLYNYEIIGESENISDSSTLIIVGIIAGLSAVFYLSYRAIQKWKHSQSATSLSHS